MRISKQFEFEASHILPRHPGKCRNLHGHSWKLEVAITGAIDAESGFVLDYNVLTTVLKPLVDVLDHTHLNWLLAYPSSEVLTGRFLLLLRPFTLIPGITEVEASVQETRKTLCSGRLADLDLDGAALARLTAIPDAGSFEVLQATVVKPTMDEVRAVQRRWLQAVDDSNRLVRSIAEASRA